MASFRDKIVKTYIAHAGRTHFSSSYIVTHSYNVMNMYTIHRTSLPTAGLLIYTNIIIKVLSLQSNSAKKSKSKNKTCTHANAINATGTATVKYVILHYNRVCVLLYTNILYKHKVYTQ